MRLKQDLSTDKQNLIYARNGTGKSFIARALRLFDQTVFSRYEQSSIPDLLVSEEPLMHMAPVARVCHQMLRLRLGRGKG